MALGSSLAGQIGLALEDTYGVYKAPTVWIPYVDESLTSDTERVESKAIIAGRRVPTSEQWEPGKVVVGGDIGLEMFKRNLGKLFTVMFGGVATTGSGPYTHTFTPGDLTGKSLTIQKGVPGVGGTVFPLTYLGCKVASWEIACQAGEVATLGVTIIAQREVGYRTVADGVTTDSSKAISSATANWYDDDDGAPISGTGIAAGATVASHSSATAASLSANATADGTSITFTIGIPLGTASYTSGLGMPFKFNHGAVSIGSASVPVKSATFSGDNGLSDDRYFLGARHLSEPLEKQLRVYDGELEVEWTDRTQYDRFRRGSEVALVCAFTSGADTFTITENVRFDGETPQMGGGGDIVAQTVPFKAIASAADSTAITVTLVNGDSTP